MRDMDRENLIRKGNDSLAISAIWGISGLAISCPLCFVAGGAFLANSIRVKLKGD